MGFIVLIFVHFSVLEHDFLFCWMNVHLLYLISRGKGALKLKGIEIENHNSRLRGWGV